MPVFKLFFKITKSNRFIIIMYYAIFLAIFFIINAAGLNQQGVSLGFQETSVTIGIVDNDNTELSQGILSFLKTRHTLIPLENDTKKIHDAIYEMRVSGIIEIPEGFSEDFMLGKTSALTSIPSPNDFSGSYLINTQLEDFLGNVKLYKAMGLSLADSLSHAEKLADTTASVSFQDGEKVTTESEMPGAYFYFRYFPYIALCVMLACVCPVLVTFYSPEVYRRTVCSRLPLKSSNIQLALSILCFTLLILVSLDVIGLITQHQNITIGQIGYLLLNTFIFSLVSTSVAFLCGFIAKSEIAVSGLSNVIGLSFCFLGGIFVSLDVMPAATLAFAKLLPTYWYTQANQAIFSRSTIDSSQVFLGVGLQFLFAAAIFSVGLLISQRRQQSIHV